METICKYFKCDLFPTGAGRGCRWCWCHDLFGRRFPFCPFCLARKHEANSMWHSGQRDQIVHVHKLRPNTLQFRIRARRTSVKFHSNNNNIRRKIGSGDACNRIRQNENYGSEKPHSNCFATRTNGSLCAHFTSHD